MKSESQNVRQKTLGGPKYRVHWAELTPDERRERKRALDRNAAAAYRVRRDAASNKLPTLNPDNLGDDVETLPALDPLQLAKVMRHVSYKAVRFANEVMHDESQEMRWRMAGANLLIQTGWAKCPSDPSVLIVNQNGGAAPAAASMEATHLQTLLARLRGADHVIDVTPKQSIFD